MVHIEIINEDFFPIIMVTSKMRSLSLSFYKKLSDIIDEIEPIIIPLSSAIDLTFDARNKVFKIYNHHIYYFTCSKAGNSLMKTNLSTGIHT